MARPKVKSSKGESSTLRVPALTLYSESEMNQTSPHICAICDEGGKLVLCDGGCHRHFHMSVDDPSAKAMQCPSINLDLAEIGKWQCVDCQNHVSIYFGYHDVGRTSVSVKKCPHPNCYRHYCSKCLSSEAAQCGLHACALCKGGHIDDSDGYLVQCLRCPLAWHAHCLEFMHAKKKTGIREWWFHKYANQPVRGMMYCPLHPIEPALNTPIQDHISWI